MMSCGILRHSQPSLAVSKKKWHVYNVEQIIFSERQLLNDAIKSGNIRAIHHSLQYSSYWKRWDQNGQSVLHVAIEVGYNNRVDETETINILKIFLQNGMSAYVKNKHDERPLHLAVKYKMKMVVLLLLRYADTSEDTKQVNRFMVFYIIQYAYEQHCTNIQQAKSQIYESEYIKFIDWFLSQGFSVNIKNKNGNTPLHVAAKCNLIEIMWILLKHNGRVVIMNNNRKTVLHFFVENMTACNEDFLHPVADSKYQSEIKIILQLLKRGLSVNDIDGQGNTLIHLVARKCRPDVMKLVILLMRLGIVNARNHCGQTALHILNEHCVSCSNNQHREEYANIAKILIRWGANINARNIHGMSPLQLAVMRAHVPILKVMIDSGADFNVMHGKSNLLHLFAGNANKNVSNEIYDEIISTLVSRGCNINAKNKNGRTPLLVAVQLRCCDIIPWLIKYGANVHIRNPTEDRLTALHEAIINEDLDMVDILFKVGADLYTRTKSGRSLLHFSSSFDMVSKLLRLGACLNFVDSSNHVPLYDAIRRQDINIVEEMLKFGADINDIDIYCAVSDSPSMSPVLEIVLKHWIKIKAVLLPVYEPYKLYFNGEFYANFYSSCLFEVNTLKHTQITNRITFYNFLHMDWNFRCAFLNNKNLRKFVDSTDLANQFPEYHVLITASYYETAARQRLLEPAMRAWYELTKIMLPDVCVYRILAHLKNLDLRTMIEGAKDRNYKKPIIVPDNSHVINHLKQMIFPKKKPLQAKKNF